MRGAFAENFTKRGDVGAAVCVYVDGKPVVDLWGGFADAARTRPWERDTIVSVASTTKGLTTLCTHMLVERSVLDLDAPVDRYWPSLPKQEKKRSPCAGCQSPRGIACHQAGHGAAVTL